jgi:hypothetical protein
VALSPAPSQGSHHLTPAFGGTSIPQNAPQRAPRRKRSGVVLAVLGAVIVCVACVGIQWSANLAYDDALGSFEDAVAQAASAQNQLEQSVDALAETASAASTIAAADTGSLMDPTAKDVLAAALAEATGTGNSTAELVDETLPKAGEKPFWAWELFGGTTELNAENAAVSAQRSEFESARTDADDVAETVSEVSVSAVVSAAHAADAFEAAHVSARNLDILTLRRIAASLADVEALDSSVADGYEQLEAAAAAMLSSEQAEIDEKYGALFEARIAAEEFARGLAPGVLLDFDWSPYVNGYGDGGGMGGLATWWYGDPGYATIELSNSVADLWPSSRSQALIAHEVGHAISVKCEGMYDDSSSESIEAWATAWAISQGFTDDANGTSAYGPPPQELVGVAAGCR